MTFLPQKTPLGDLTLEEVFDAFDGPRLFLCRNQLDQRYVGIYLGEDDQQRERWLYLPVSAARLGELRVGATDLRDAFQTSETHYVHETRVGLTGQDVSFESRLSSDLTEDELPAAGEHLVLPDAATDAAIPADWFLKNPKERLAVAQMVQTALEDSREHKRERVSVRISRHSHEVPARFLSALLHDIQTTVDGLSRGGTGSSDLSVLATVAASFDLELASEEHVRGLLKQTKAGRGLAALFSLMRLGADKEQLHGRLAELPKRTANRYKRMILTLQQAHADATFVWASPSQSAAPVQVAALSMDTQGTLAGFLEEYESKEGAPYAVVGRLQALHLRRRTFELLTDTGTISGPISPEAFAVAKTATMNRTYKAFIQDVIEINQVTGEEKTTRRMVSLEKETGGLLDSE